MNWINIHDEQPEYYKNLAIKTEDGCVLHGWSMVATIDRLYFVSLDVDMVIDYSDVTHWAYIWN